MELLEIIKLLVGFVVGGGLVKLLDWRNAKRISNNSTNKIEFKTMDEIVSIFTLRLGEMGLKLADMSSQNLISLGRTEMLSKELEKEKKEKSLFQKNLLQASEKIKQYEQYLKEIHIHCKCPDHEGLKTMKDDLGA